MKKEVLKVAQHCVTKECFYSSCKFGAFPSGECIAYFAKAIVEHHEKFRWHDLQKNPDDLPSEFKDVLVDLDGCFAVWAIIYYYSTYCWQDESGILRNFDEVIAWRELEGREG